MSTSDDALKACIDHVFREEEAQKLANEKLQAKIIREAEYLGAKASFKPFNEMTDLDMEVTERLLNQSEEFITD